MAYADPQSTSNPTTGQPILAAWGDVVRDDLEYLARNRPHCRVYNSANISISSGSTTALTFNSERFDVGGMHSTSSNTGRITVPSGEGGKYRIDACVSFAANVTGARATSIRLNGTTIIARVQHSTAASGVVVQNPSCLYALAAGDYVEVIVDQDSGGALNVLATGNYSPEFSAMWEAI